jgi:hypothetical protein
MMSALTAQASDPSSPSRPPLIHWILALALLFAAAFKAWVVLHAQPLGTDFLPVWTAGRMVWSAPGHVYDIAAIGHAEAWLKPILPWPRPFAYPPTALLMFAPLGGLPFWTALGVWLAICLAIFVAASARLAGRGASLPLLLTLCATPVVLAVLAGQTVLLVAGLAVLAMIELPSRPRLAGALFAIAAAIKPQAMLLAPVALLAAGATEALVTALVVGVLLGAASLIVLGPAIWMQWLGCFAPFQAVIDTTPSLAQGVVTPYGAGRALGLDGLALGLWRATFALVGIAFVWRVFSGSAKPTERLVALMGASLLVAPYAMYYDASLIAPALAVIAVERAASRDWLIRLLAYGAMCEMTTPYLGLAALVVAMVCGGEPWRGLTAPKTSAQTL